MFSKLETIYGLFKKLIVTIVTPPKPSNGTTPLTEPLLKN